MEIMLRMNTYREPVIDRFAPLKLATVFSNVARHDDIFCVRL